MKKYFYIVYWFVTTLLSSFLFRTYFESFFTAWMLTLMMIPAVLVFKILYPKILKENGFLKLLHFFYLGVFILYLEYLCVFIYFWYLFELNILLVPSILVNPVFLGIWMYFFISIEKVLEKVLFVKNQFKEEDTFLEFISNRKNIKVKTAEILFVESNDNEVWVHTTHSRYRTKMRINQWENVLDEQVFIRIHRSYIINRNKISKLESNSVYIKDTNLEISRKYQAAVKEMFSLH